MFQAILHPMNQPYLSPLQFIFFQITKKINYKQLHSFRWIEQYYCGVFSITGFQVSTLFARIGVACAHTARFPGHTGIIRAVVIVCGQSSPDMFVFITLSLSLCLFTILLIAKIYFKLTNGVCRCNTDVTGKVILITGGNSDIGKEYVLEMASRGAKVIMACRNVEKANTIAQEIALQTGNDQIFVEKCDLGCLANVAQCCQRIKQQQLRIDVLVCFAAAVGNAVQDSKTDDGFETQFQCNYLSHFLMIQMLLDLLKPTSRVILTSSAAHLFGKIDLRNISRMDRYKRHGFLAYGDSKLALVMLAKELSERLAHTGVCINSFHPGTVYTAGIKNAPTWYLYYPLTLLAFLYGKTAKDGAQTMIHLTVSEEVNGITGRYFADCEVAPHNRAANDRKLRSGLWDLSMKLIAPFVGPNSPQSIEKQSPIIE